MNEEKSKVDKRIDLIVAIMLGVTAVLTAYASWQGSLYDGNQSQKYTAGMAAISEANSLYNEAAQYIAMDSAAWNTISDLRVDLEFATSKNDRSEIERIEYKIDKAMYENVDENLAAAIQWADAQEEYASPFEKEGFMESYFADADAKYDEGQQLIASGTRDNDLGDRQGLVTVIFAVVLFLLGMAAFFDERKTKLVLVGISAAGFVFASIFMLTVPMLTL